MTDIYCSTFCNRGHRLNDGKPVGHECYVLNPKALELERAGKFEELGSGRTAVHFGAIHRGLKALVPVLVAIVAVGCGTVQSDLYSCEIEGLGAVRSEVELDCAIVQEDFDLAVDILQSKGLIDGRGIFRGLPVTVKDTDAIKRDGDQVTTGVYGTAGITLTRSLQSLLHELLHHVDTVRFERVLQRPSTVEKLVTATDEVLGSYHHRHWPTNGYDDADLEYEHSYRSPLTQAPVVHAASTPISD